MSIFDGETITVTVTVAVDHADDSDLWPQTREVAEERCERGVANLLSIHGMREYSVYQVWVKIHDRSVVVFDQRNHDCIADAEKFDHLAYVLEVGGAAFIFKDTAYDPRVREMIADHTIDHPEVGRVLDSQCGAQSPGCAYDTEERSGRAAPLWLKHVLEFSDQQPVPLVDPVLASDGWWWRVS